MPLNLAALTQTLTDHDAAHARGHVRELVGLALRAELPDACVGELVRIERSSGGEPLLAEVVGFDARGVTLLPLGEVSGLAPGDVILPERAPLSVRFGADLLGRVLDGLGRPIDGGPELTGELLTISRPAPAPLERTRISEPMPLGIRALDAFATLGKGQRVGLFSGSGVGKSTLLGQIARHAAADVVVLCLVGERGRELSDFLEDHLGDAGRARSVVVCATSDAPALLRMKCPYVATTLAEGFRDQGLSVLLLVDSVTRFARAAREVGLAAGEAPVRRGYPPSVFAALPGLIERAGTAKRGSITGIYSVLVEGDDLDEPIADELRGLLDGHVVLSRALFSRGRRPAIDVPRSLSRLFGRLVSDAQRAAADALRAELAYYEEKRDLVLLGAYRKGSDAKLDAALARIDRLEAFLAQHEREHAPWDATLRALTKL